MKGALNANYLSCFLFSFLSFTKDEIERLMRKKGNFFIKLLNTSTNTSFRQA